MTELETGDHKPPKRTDAEADQILAEAKVAAANSPAEETIPIEEHLAKFDGLPHRYAHQNEVRQAGMSERALEDSFAKLCDGKDHPDVRERINAMALHSTKHKRLLADALDWDGDPRDDSPRAIHERMAKMQCDLENRIGTLEKAVRDNRGDMMMVHMMLSTALGREINRNDVLSELRKALDLPAGFIPFGY